MNITSVWKRFALGVMAFWIIGCNDPTDLGKDLLKDSLNETESTQQLGISFVGGYTDSVLVYQAYRESQFRTSSQISVFVAGDMEDPIFGKTKSEIYTQFRTDPRPDLDLSAKNGFVVDSAYMVVFYDTTGFYGDSLAPIDINVFGLTEVPDPRADYYTTKTFETSSNPIGWAKGLLPSLKDSFYIYFRNRFNEPDTFKIHGAAKVLFKDPSFLQGFLLDTTAFFQPKELPNFLPGIKVEVATGGKRLIGLDFNSPRSFIQVYYHSPDTIINHRFYFDERLEYENPLVRVVHQSHEYTGTPVQEYIANPEKSESAFLQGLSGIRSKLQLGDIPTELDGKISVSLAKLHIPVKVLPGDNTKLFTPPISIVTATKDDAGVYILTKEAQYAWESFLRTRDYIFLNSRYGGVLSKDKDTGQMYYDINITSFVQDYLFGRNDGSFYLSLVGSQNNPKRVVFCTLNSMECPTTLSVIYTKY